jgi:flagellar protein FliS
MAVMNPYNYARPRNFIKVEPDVKEEKVEANALSRPLKTTSFNKADQYLENKVLNAKPEELTLMLYEGLVKFIKKALIYIEDENPSEVNYNAQRAQAILDELRATLNQDIAISESLESLYEYMSFKLVEANIEKSEILFNEILEMAVSFKETWKEAFGLKD